MSRPRTHRKSMSTSALSVLAGTSALGAALDARPGRPGGEPRVDKGKGRARDEACGLDDARRYLDDIRSLRSSSRRRTAAVRGIERCLLAACDGHVVGRFLELKAHQPLLALLARHTSTLTRRSSSSLPPGDDVARALGGEIEPAVGALQGLCLLSRQCRDAVGERWVLESIHKHVANGQMIIDLLLLLRAQAASADRKPIACALLDLVFCVLVDRPDHARLFEALGGLEAATRVLKGTGVAKEVRMKCVEFLYFYLLPENTGRRSASAASSSSSSSASSALYPPSPLDTTALPPSPAPTPVAPLPAASPTKSWDLDLAFVPQTPRKPARHELGFPTPSARRVSTASSAASTPVPGTPGSVAPAPLPPPDFRRARRDSREVGLGLGRLAECDDAGDESGGGDAAGRAPVAAASGAAFADPFARSTSRAGSAGSTTSSITVTPRRPSPAASAGSSAGSSSGGSVRARAPSAYLVPGPAPRLPRSSTQPSLARAVPRVPSSTAAPRARSPLAPADDPPALARGPHAHARSRSDLSGLAAGAAHDRAPATRRGEHPAVPATPAAPTPRKPRAFPAQLTRGLPSAASVPNLAGLAGPGPAPLGPARRVSGVSRQPSAGSCTLDKARDDAPGKHDGARAVRRDAPERVRSVDEKKEMLGRWLGNVDQLVQGVERAGIWAGIK